MANGGIIGPTNVTSFGKNTITSKTSSGCISLQPGTKIIDAAVVAGGGGGSSGGGGAGGLRQFSNLSVCGSVPATIGAGGAANANSGVDSSLVAGGTTYTSAGGGAGGIRSPSPQQNGGDGGSGGGGAGSSPGGND
jgi:type IV secretion system protein TrbL